MCVCVVLYCSHLKPKPNIRHAFINLSQSFVIETSAEDQKKTKTWISVESLPWTCILLKQENSQCRLAFMVEVGLG